MMNKTVHFITEELWSSKLAMSLLAGVLLGLSYPPFPFPFLMFPAWILLFRIAELSISNREAAFWSYIAFVVWNLITTYWLMMATLAGGVAAILANSVVMTIPFVLQRQFQKKLTNPWLIAVLHAAPWIGYEYLHHLWDLAWPWLSLGNAWSEVPELVQYISFTGYWSITFWILVTASLAWQAIKTTDARRAYGAAFTVLILPAISMVQYYSVEFSPVKRVEAVVVQPNFDTYHTYGGYDSISQTQDVLFNLSDSLRTDSTDLLLWPENAVRTYISSRENQETTPQRIKNQLREKADTWNLSLITGTTYFDYFSADSLPPLARNSQNSYYLFYNAALGFYPEQTYEVYRKHNLVPIVERVPFAQYLDTIDIFDWINWQDLQGYGKGHKAQQFQVDGTATPALVCYDSVFPNWVREYVRNGSGFISIITNDGWWGNTSGHLQHFSFARLRAIEFRRWIVRSANNGISGIINPYGNIEVKTNYWKKTAFRYQVPVMNVQTPYTRWGDWFPASMIILTFMGLVSILITTVKNKGT